MYTDSAEYTQVLAHIQDNNPPSLAILLPKNEPFYEVDLNTRIISVPDILSIRTDHRSETVYFKVGRFHDEVDLSTMVCIIQYINANKEGRVYPVPYYDIDTFSDTDEMIFPWIIDQEVTKAAGTVKFSIRFYELDPSGKFLLYNISTLPAQTRIEKDLEMTYDEVYVEIPLTVTTYQKGKYYTMNRNKTYSLATGDFDAHQTYYERHVLNNDITDWNASFIDQMLSLVQEATQRDLTWVVLT